MENLKSDLVGKIFETNFSGKCEVVKYVTAKELYVRFDDGTIVRTMFGNLKRGVVGNPTRSKVFGVGINDDREYTKTKEYVLWHSMLRRCYSEVYQKDKPRYVGCYVSDDWKLFSNFRRDIVHIPFFDTALNGNYELDKDILFTGNKVYSKETVCFVPREINSALIKKDGISNGYMIGVYKSLNSNRYKASTSAGVLNTYRKKFGMKTQYATEIEAHQAYLKCKKAYLADLANKYNGEIEQRVFEALMNYQVEIDD